VKVLILSQFFDPEPTLKGLAFALALQRQGFDVEVLTGFPNYPGGKVFPGYRIRPWQREMMEGVRVTRVALYPSHDRSAPRRVFNYISFALAAAFLGPFLVRRPDVIFVYHPPVTIALPAMVLRAWSGAPFAYEIQDLWPDTLRATGMFQAGRLFGLLDRVCRVAYRRADQLVVISEGFRRRLVERGIPSFGTGAMSGAWSRRLATRRTLPRSVSNRASW
jgi:colanic acid biosynthesis glycosyl transferase WcaI